MCTKTDIGPALPTIFFLTFSRMHTRTNIGPALPTPFFLSCPRMRTRKDMSPALPKHHSFWHLRACEQGKILGLRCLCHSVCSVRACAQRKILGLRCLHHSFWPHLACAQGKILGLGRCLHHLSDLSAHTHKDINFIGIQSIEKRESRNQKSLIRIHKPEYEKPYKTGNLLTAAKTP